MKKKREKVPTEREEQKAIAAFIGHLRTAEGRELLWWHTPNEGRRSYAGAASLKKEGVLRGVADIIIVDAPPRYPHARGVAIELKRIRGSKTSDEQREFLEKIKARGWITHIAKGAKEAARFLTEECGFLVGMLEFPPKSPKSTANAPAVFVCRTDDSQLADIAEEPR